MVLHDLDCSGLSDFLYDTQFMDCEDQALEWIAYYRTEGKCPHCKQETEWCKVKNNSPRHSGKMFYCPLCAYQLSPLAGTIFHRTRTSLFIWSAVDRLSGEGKSASEIARAVGASYKPILRIKQLFKQTWTSL